jgi:ribosomal protein S18 acetylase RimI-like enzyme
MDMFEIYDARIDDLAEILAVQRLAFYQIARHFNNFRLRPLMVSLKDLELSFEVYRFFKAVAGDGTIVGSIKARVLNNICKVESLFVHPDFQRQGIGQRLLAHTEASMGPCGSYELFTGRDSPGNVAFYQRQGYRLVSEIPASASEPVLVVLQKQKV